MMVEVVGILFLSVGCIWVDVGLKLYIVKGFKVLNDLMFEEKVIEIVGFYFDLLDWVVVFCVDEKL